MRYLGFDTETSGLDPKKCVIVEIALVEREYITGDDGNDSSVGDHCQTWVLDPGLDSGFSMPPEVAAIHGITDEVIREEGRPSKDVLEEIATKMAQFVKEGGLLVAYNAGFDIRMINADLARNGLRSLEERVPEGFLPIIDPYCLDQILDQYRKGQRRLTDLAGFYGADVDGNLHRAAIDTQVTLDVLELMRTKYPEIDKMTPQELFNFQRDGYKKRIESRNEWVKTNGKFLKSTRWP